MQPCRVAVVLLGLALQCATVSAWGYCNDNDLSCAMWANNKECEGSNADVVKIREGLPRPIEMHQVDQDTRIWMINFGDKFFGMAE